MKFLRHVSAPLSFGPPFVRARADLRGIMRRVLIALTPCVLFALYNTGRQANAAMATRGPDFPHGWRGDLLSVLGGGHDPADLWGASVHGLLYLLPIWIVAVLTGRIWERLFATLREREIHPGLSVIALLYALSLPPTLPLWQVALGISFGVVVGKEIFGGTGRNFLNPALAGLAFLYFAYPEALRSDAVWTVVDGTSGATRLSLATEGGLGAIARSGTTWWQAFAGTVPGAPGETSTIACLVGAIILIATRVAAWRIMAGGLIGMVATAIALGGLVNPSLAIADVPWYWHLVLGSFAFGLVFFATDPVTAAITDAGRWIYGGLIGFSVAVIRVANPAYPEGVMLAILFANVFAPLIDHGVIRANVRRRARRGA